MSEPSESPSTVDVVKPSGPVRTPGTRTPRRVQWATAVTVDEDEDDGDYDTADEDDGDHHGLDQAGLDVCRFSFPLHFSLTVFVLHSLLPSERSPMPSNVIIAQILPRRF
jgi:hypothetical protein